MENPKSRFFVGMYASFGGITYTPKTGLAELS